MNAVDSHIHWFPEAYFELLATRSGEPLAARDGDHWRFVNGKRTERLSREWFDLERQFATAAKTGLDMSVISSMGIHSDLDGLPAAEARDAARLINEEWSAAQRRYPGQFFAAAALPLQDTQMAIDELDHAVGVLGLCGASFPGSIAGEPSDALRLEPFYARVEELGVPIFIHPNDNVFLDVMDGYEGGLYSSLGRVFDSSAAVLRIVLSGLMDRYPKLKIVHFHAGGVLPYAAGRIDKNTRATRLEEPPSAYLKRMWVDTAMPHALTIRMAMDFYGAERILYGSDNPCWNPQSAFGTLMSLKLPEVVSRAILHENVRALTDLRVPAASPSAA